MSCLHFVNSQVHLCIRLSVCALGLQTHQACLTCSLHGYQHNIELLGTLLQYGEHSNYKANVIKMMLKIQFFSYKENVAHRDKYSI